jgi:hypothetical protein
MKKTAIFGVLAVILLGTGCIAKIENREKAPIDVLFDKKTILLEAKENRLIMDDEEILEMSRNIISDSTGRNIAPENFTKPDVKKWQAAALADVTGGESFGIAHAKYEAGIFVLVAEFGNLPSLSEGFSYRGWLVKRGDQMEVVSTGVAVETQSGFVNIYKSSLDLSKHDFFVLTLENENASDSPAIHILEGSMK